MKKVLSLCVVLALAACACTAWAETLKQGSRGEAVEQAQQRLVELGYLGDRADGIYGEKTAAAVELFQFFAGIAQTGELDEASLEALYADGVRTLIAPLSSDDEGDAVRALQQRLIDLGFLDDDADGSYGKRTVAAVKAFQQHLIDQGLGGEGILEVTASGEATSMTQEYLFSPHYSSYLLDLRQGDEHGEVRRVERRLRALGYLDGEADEAFDEYTAAVVAAFQTARGLPATGAVDRATLDGMFAEDAPVAARYVAHDVAPGDTGEAVRAAQSALIRHGMLAGVADGVYGSDMESALERFHAYLAQADDPRATSFEAREILSAEAQNLLADEDFFHYSEDIQKDASEAEVMRVQRRLHTLYYMNRFSVDGDYGKNTLAAVSAFQTNNSLEPTGVADEATQRALFSEDPVGNWTPYKLEIRIDEQRVYVYSLNEDGEYEYLKDFICSTGLGNSTPTGIFTATRPLNRWHYFTKFECWAQYSYQIEGNILFHSVLYSDSSESSLRRNSVYALGSKASHGCVRLRVEDAKWIFENCEKGTVVVIH